MRFLRYVLRRALWAVLTVYAAVAATYFLGSLTLRDEIRNQLALARRRGASPAEQQELKESLKRLYGLDQPVHERILGWFVDVTTLDLGESTSYYKPVVEVLDGRVITTMEYVVPGVVLAVLLGVALGLVASVAKDGGIDWGARLVAYAVLGVPAFMVLTYMTYFAGWHVAVLGVGVDLPSPNRLTLAALAVALGLLAGQLRFSRAAALEQSGQSFVKMLRAKGAGRLRLARHVLRNAAIPIVSLSITELLAVLVLSIYVIEEALGIRGLAGASLTAAKSSNLPLLIWTTMVVVILGITLNFLQDVLYGYLDPRIRSG